ncbi:MAG: hypothetical protein MZV64_30760 [Ignavibacteriales bacterium]|nr:hypothetical protein [Ignavibacteriales bacterium]
MLEITTTRHNPLHRPAPARLGLGDPALPVRRRHGRRHDGPRRHGDAAHRAAATTPQRFFSVQTPLLGFVLLNLGMLRAVPRPRRTSCTSGASTLTFQPTSPMSWGVVDPARSSTRLLLSRRWSGCPTPGPGWPRACRCCERCPTRSPRSPARHARARAAPTSCSASRSASTPASCSARWWRGRCGTARSSAPLFLVSGLSAGGGLRAPRRARRRTSGSCWRSSTTCSWRSSSALIGAVPHRAADVGARRTSRRPRLLLGGPYTAVVLGARRRARHRAPARHPVAGRDAPDPAHADRAAAGDGRRARAALRHRLRRPVQPLDASP